MKGVLGWFVGLVVLVQEIFVLPWLLLSTQYKNKFPHQTLFQFLCPLLPANWAGSPAGSPVSFYVSLVTTEKEWLFSLTLIFSCERKQS